MSRFARRLLVLALASAIAPASAAERDADPARLAGLSLDRLLESQARIMRVADAIRVAGAPLCGDEVGPVIGVFAADARTFRDMSPRDRPYEKLLTEVATSRFDLRDERRVLLVSPGSPAERAGIAPGDLVLRIDGRAPRRSELLDVLRRSGSRVELAVQGPEGERTATAEAPLGCAFPSRFWFGTSINAFAARFGDLTGSYVIGGMLDFLPEDRDLAIILGHELAHLILNHGGAGTFRRSEADADYLGAYLAAAAGFDVSGAPAVWDRIAREIPYTTIERGFYSHPPSADRAQALAAALEEISTARSRGEALVLPKGRILERPSPDEAAVKARTDSVRAQAREQLAATQARVIAVHTRLQIGAAPLCGDQLAPVLGAAIARRRDFMFGHEKEAEEAFGAEDEVTVFAVAPGSPAEAAGVAPGDRILAVNGEDAPKTSDVFDEPRSSREGTPALRALRGSETLELTLPRVLGCSHGVRVVVASEPDTSADANRKEVVVPAALARVAQSDDELAIALAHQLAHHLQGSALLLDSDDEPAADRLGLYLAARAGFDVSGATAFWERLAADMPWKLDGDRDAGPHAGMPARIRAVRQALAEIAASDAPPQP